MIKFLKKLMIKKELSQNGLMDMNHRILKTDIKKEPRKFNHFWMWMFLGS